MSNVSDLEPFTAVGHDSLIMDAAEVLGLVEHLQELEFNGYAVVPPEKVGSPAFLRALRDAVLAVHQRRSANQVSIQMMKLAAAAGAGEIMSYILWEDPIFEKALMNPVAQTLARAMTGHACRLSLFEGAVKPAGKAPLGLHCDTAMTEPYPLVPQFSNVTYALTDYSVQNGSTTFVPGSHRLLRQPVGPEVNGEFATGSLAGAYGARILAPVPIACRAGSILAWYGATWHGAVPRVVDGERVSLLMYFCRWYLKTQENFRDHVPEGALEHYGPRFGQLLDVNPVWGFTDTIQGPKGMAGREVHPILDVPRP